MRLALTMLAGVLIGLNRGGHGHAAGLRTTVLVCLTASLSMIEVNVLLTTTGKTPASFSVIDLMRLPLGILSGMGFIGAGAILKKGEMALGVTTAATLWATTMIGFCLGGGQAELGLISLALTMLTLWGMKQFEKRMAQERHATLTVRAAGDPATQAFLHAQLKQEGFQITREAVAYHEQGQQAEWEYSLKWRCPREETTLPAILPAIAGHQTVSDVRWQPGETAEM